MRVSLPSAILLAGCLAAAQAAFGQAPASGQNQRPAAQQPGSSQSGGNPFPEDESSVPVMPSKDTSNLPPDIYNGSAGAHSPLPDDDSDPVRSPDEPAPAAASQGSSSSLSELGGLLPGPDDETQGKHKKNEQVIQTMPPETPKEDISVGNYYMDIKDWRGALSRFQSALVLAPDDPDVYWGLAECERHTGDFASARANYLKVMEYDPDSHHAKDAKKALTEPEIENAKASNGTRPAQQTQP